MDRTGTIENLLADVGLVLEELRAEAMEEIRAAKERADANVARYEEARRELVSVEAEIAALSEEHETLPNLAYRAGMDGRREDEERLTERYRNLGPALASLEERGLEVGAEMAGLKPRSTGHPNDCTLSQYGEAALVAHGARADLESLQKRLTEALDRAVVPVTREHENLKATVWQLSHDRDWALSPVGRGGLRA